MSNEECDDFCFQSVYMCNLLIGTELRCVTDSDCINRLSPEGVYDAKRDVFTCNQPYVLNIKSVLFARLQYASNLINELVIYLLC